MEILLIGNGFDLAHELPTKYSDFMKFIQVLKSINQTVTPIDLNFLKNHTDYEELNDSIKDYLKFNLIEHKIDNNFIEEFNKLITNNCWIEYFKNKIDVNKGWIDFESEIAEVIKNLDYLMEYTENSFITNTNDFSKLDSRVQKILIPHFLDSTSIVNRYFYGNLATKKIKTLVNDLNDLIRCLELYLGEIIESITAIKYVPTIYNLEIDKILSFNYTNTYKKIYDDNEHQIEYDYIHGNVDILREPKNNNMVLGINEYLEDDEKDKKIEFIEFKKYFQRIFKRTGSIYKKWIIEMNEYSADTHNLYVFGHSLDTTDKDILNDLITLDNIRTTIFYHDETSYKQYITNLVKLIGQDKLIEKVYGENPSIIFKNQNEKFKQIKGKVYDPLIYI